MWETNHMGMPSTDVAPVKGGGALPKSSPPPAPQDSEVDGGGPTDSPVQQVPTKGGASSDTAPAKGGGQPAPGKGCLPEQFAPPKGGATFEPPLQQSPMQYVPRPAPPQTPAVIQQPLQYAPQPQQPMQPYVPQQMMMQPMYQTYQLVPVLCEPKHECEPPKHDECDEPKHDCAPPKHECEPPKQEHCPKPEPKPHHPPKHHPHKPKSKVTLSNNDKKYEVGLKSNKGTKLTVHHDPHVIATVNGKTSRFDLGKGPGKIRLNGGANGGPGQTTVHWTTDKRSHIAHFTIDMPGNQHDVQVSTKDGVNVNALKTALTDSQLRELISKMRQMQGPAHEQLKQGKNRHH